MVREDIMSLKWKVYGRIVTQVTDNSCILTPVAPGLPLARDA